MHSQFLLLLVSALCLVSQLGAATLTVGSDNSRNCYPFACAPEYGLTRFQQQYSPDAFGETGSILINSLSFFAKSGSDGLGTDSGTYDVYLATSTTAFGAATSDFDSNLGSDLTLFATVSFGPSMPEVFTIIGSTPFFYDPSKGALVLDVRPVSGTLLDNEAYFSADTTGVALRSYNNTSGTTLNVKAALVTEFGYAEGGEVPEPGTIVLAGIGLVALVYRSRCLNKS